MPRQATWPPLINVCNGRDRIRVRGIDYYTGPAGSLESKQEYARLVLELSKLQPEPAKPEPTPLTVEDVAAKWKVHALAQHAGNLHEAESYERALAVLLEECPGLPAAEFDVDRLESVRERMTSIRGWCRSYTNRQVGRIKTVWRWAERRKMVPPGSWGHLRTLPALLPNARVKESPPRKPCSWDDVQAVAKHLQPKPRTMLLLGWHSGARPGEFRQLQVGEVDRSGAEWVCRPAKHKCAWRGQERAIVLGPAAKELIVPFLFGKTAEEFVFPSRGGKPYHARGLCNSIKTAADRAGVKLTFYQARHAYRRRISKLMGLEACRAAMGHRSVETTAKYAAGTDEELARKVAREAG